MIKKLGVLPLALATTVVLAGAATASASVNPAGPARAAATVGPVRQLASGTQHLPRRAGTTDCPKLSRTSGCEVFPGSIAVVDDGKPVGKAILTITVGWHTEIKSRHFVANVTVDTLSTPVSYLGATITASCDRPCSSSGAVTGPVTAGVEFSGTLHFQDTTATRHVNLATFTLTPINPRGVSSGGSGKASTSIRCDDLLKPQSAGCVVNGFAPTLTTMAGLPLIAKNIRKVQARGVHLGKPGSMQPLTKITNQAERDKHYNQMCPKSRKPPKNHPDWECDEYPFATTAQGGTSGPEEDRGTAWVPPAEQRSQGGRILAFTKQQRLLSGDDFYVEV